LISGQLSDNKQVTHEQILTDDLTIPTRSLFIETIGVIILIYLFALPIYLSLHTSLIIAPILHLFSYVILKYLLNLSITEESHLIYSSMYYRWWFLQRLWKLNHPWHQLLYGTSLYNTYLRLCGAQIGSDTCIQTSAIDVPHLIHIGDQTFVGEDILLSSMTYDSVHTFKLTSVWVGNNCSIAARSVLHSKVIITNDVTVKSLSSLCEYFLHLHLLNNLYFVFYSRYH
jgi:hypothetical protein